MAQGQRCSVGTTQEVPPLAFLGMFSTLGRFRCTGFFFFLDITITPTMTVLHVLIAQAPVRGNGAGDGLDPGRITQDCRPTPSLLATKLLVPIQPQTHLLIQTSSDLSVFTLQCTTQAMLYSSKPTEKVSSYS